MTVVGFFFVIVGLLLSVVLSMAFRSMVCVGLFIYHLAASIFYWNYSLTHSADAVGYYEHVPGDDEFGVGTSFIRAMTSTLRDLFDASYLDMFMLFHLFGYIGIVLLYALCRQVLLEDDVLPRGRNALLLAIAFLPGLHWWTSAIGKDGLIFLGIVCFVWGAAEPRRRALSLTMGLGLCVLVRPHMAVMLAAACALGVALSGDVPLRWRLTTTCLLLGGLILAIPLVGDFLRLETLDADTVADYVKERQGYNLAGGSSVDISSYGFVMQFFTYMFRPLFVDAQGALALVVSLENLFYLGGCLYYAPALIRTLWAGEGGFFVRFNFFFWLTATSILAATTSNLGIAIRQKTMVLPSLLLVLLVASRSSAAQAAQVPATAEPS